MNLFQTLTEKSWIPQSAEEYIPLDSIELRRSRVQTALRFFIAMVSVIFFLFTITFLSRTQFSDFQALAGEPWQPFSDPTQLWLNTSALFLAGVSLHCSFFYARKTHANGAIFGFSLAFFFSLLFLIGQLAVWKQLYQMGYYVNSNPANSFFYLLTSIHGLHLAGGIIALILVILKYIRNNSIIALSGGLGLCVTYWHFLLVVWLLLFALLTSTSDTYNAIALFCGF